jgi:diguanylate cyclase (GGDEF)-like protein
MGRAGGSNRRVTWGIPAERRLIRVDFKEKTKLPVSQSEAETAISNAESPDRALMADLSRIERKDWWSWGFAILVILLLTGGIFSLALPSFFQNAESLFRIKLEEAVFGLIALIILFIIYAVHQQILIKRLRRQLAEKQGHSRILRNLAMIDPLTGLYNRRFAEQRLSAEVARSSRKGLPFCILLLDLNDFKQINDTHGHPAGDLVLQEFANRLNAAIRESDLAVRMGGDEFLVILPDCRAEQLQGILARLTEISVEWQGARIPVKFAAGWKAYEAGETPEQVLASADQSLYDGKRTMKESAKRRA